MGTAMPALLPWFVRLELLGGVCLQGSPRLALRLSSLCEGANKYQRSRIRSWQSFEVTAQNSELSRCNVVAELVERAISQ